MSKKALVPFLLCLISACATPTTTYEIERTATYTTDIVGRWFPCEFILRGFDGYRTTDDCVTLDDDGLLFAGDGTVSRIEFTKGNRANCAFGNVGKCFRYDADDLALEAVQIATWVKEDNSIKVTKRGGCVASLVIQAKTSHSVFRVRKKSPCKLLWLDANATRQVRMVGGVLMRRHVGTVAF